MQKPVFYLFLILFLSTHFCVFAQSKALSKTDFIRTSQNFLYAAKTGDSTSVYLDTLQKADENLLLNQLSTDQKRLAFWLNLYNGFTQVLLKKNPDQYKTRGSFFSSNQINITGHLISLDLIEHGILRHSKVKWSLGYLEKIFPSKFEKQLRVQKLDYRIHFALNCGAKSCPPIAFYDPKQIDKQLNIAVKTYLRGECEYDQSKNVVSVPALMNWFRHDFGGKKHMLEILKQNNIVPSDKYPAIQFKKYDWSLYLNNYKNENNG